MADRRRRKKRTSPTAPLKKVQFVTTWDERYKIYLRLQGDMSDAHATDLGLVWKEPKDDYGGSGHFSLEYPVSVLAVKMLVHVCKAKGYDAIVELKDTHGKDASDMLLPTRVAHLQRRTVEHHGGKEYQADKRVYALARKYITLRHQHLASAAVLIVIEDFDPDAKARKMGLAGQVAGYAKKTPAAMRKAIGFDFQISMCRTIWDASNARMRAFLIDHELRHCQRDEKGRWVLKDHDIQFHSGDLIYWPDMVKDNLRQIEMTQKAAKEMREKKDRPTRKRRQLAD